MGCGKVVGWHGGKKEVDHVRSCDHDLLLFSCSVMPDSFATPLTVACQAPLSMRFPRHEYWSGLPFPSPGGLRGFNLSVSAGGSHWKSLNKKDLI